MRESYDQNTFKIIMVWLGKINNVINKLQGLKECKIIRPS